MSTRTSKNRPAELRAHDEWLGFVQPVGLVVSPPALVAAQAFPNRNIAPEQLQFLSLLPQDPSDPRARLPRIDDWPRFFQTLLQWQPSDLIGGPGGDPLPDTLSTSLPEYADHLRPTYAVRSTGANAGWMLLVQVLPQGQGLDDLVPGVGWVASAQARFERLLRECEVPIGLLCAPDAIRLVHAPRGESSGHITFPVKAMTEVAGRAILAALVMLLHAERLFSLPTAQRLPALLVESRRYQNEVSTQLAEQVLSALYELLRGLQAADAATQGVLLGGVLRAAPQDVYGALLTSLMRLVFLLYAEDRGVFPSSAVYQQHYSVGGLFEQLRADESRYPDTMDQRFGAWARLLAVFRLAHDGGGHGALKFPARHGRLFDPNAYPFLEGRPYGAYRQNRELNEVPRISDGVVLRVLENLLLIAGERLSYRNLDVEQIGSVYEAMMGFSVEMAEGPSVAVGPASVVVNVEQLLAEKDRAKALEAQTGVKFPDAGARALKTATTADEVLAALGKRVSPLLPNVLPAGTLYLQPSLERRHTGTEYTPKALTAPIVRTTLEPLMARLGPQPTAEQILSLKVCDPAMGSGAFLVAACEFLAKQLVSAWQVHGSMPTIPPDEDSELHAKRLVAQRCLYGVDKNPFAVDLAKLSLWLTTLAREHPFTFLDHALKHGDALVGLTRDQLESFHWEPSTQLELIRGHVRALMTNAARLREKIHALGDSDDQVEKRRLHQEADETLENVRLLGDLVVAAFFNGSKAKEREAGRLRHLDLAKLWLDDKVPRHHLSAVTAALREGEKPIVPFHWHHEFPEVFTRENPGFDAFVGNPPFAGKNTIAAGNREGFISWLQAIHPESHGQSDLVAHFFRSAFELLRKDGCFGLIATNTIRQGDTRTTGLLWICKHGGTIFNARRRYKWPGRAAVVISVVHVIKGQWTGPRLLDGREVPLITAFLFHDGGHDDPHSLKANEDKSFQGSNVLGMGFTFDDTDKKGEASPLAEMKRLIEKDPRNAERIFPYLGGEEVNDSPTHSHHRYVINFEQLSEEEARRWPDLMAIVEERVRPKRERDNREARAKYWWRFAEVAPSLYAAIRPFKRVLAISRVSDTAAFTFLPTVGVLNEKIVVFQSDSTSLFSLLQSRIHEVWARFFSSTLKDDFQYTPSKCFETFPFPPSWNSEDSPLEEAGRAYYEFRARLMIEFTRESGRDVGLTATYNRFHDPLDQDPRILELRALHDRMDRAVLDAYGWTDLQPTCDFQLEHEDEDAAADGSATSSRRKKPWRYRWPDALREEVLARLLKENAVRAEAERHAGLLAAPEPKPPPKPKASRKPRKPSRSPKPVTGDLGLLLPPKEK
ncbi:MAG TPA: DNA methyltransferase [Archangium sp.]|nr:DNA methyltransferase [Archangium sp.]